MGWEGASMMLFMKNLVWTKQKVEAILQEACKDHHGLVKHIYARVYAD